MIWYTVGTTHNIMLFLKKADHVYLLAQINRIKWIFGKYNGALFHISGSDDLLFRMYLLYCVWSTSQIAFESTSTVYVFFFLKYCFQICVRRQCGPLCAEISAVGIRLILFACETVCPVCDLAALRGKGIRAVSWVLRGCSVKFTAADLFLKTSGEALQMVFMCVDACSCVHMIYLHWCIILQV